MVASDAETCRVFFEADFSAGDPRQSLGVRLGCLTRSGLHSPVSPSGPLLLPCQSNVDLVSI